MILSMTGFGKAVVMTQNKKITAEIKSLNSKQLDLSVRIPYAFRELELEIRNCVAKRLERGKVDLSILVENNDNQETSVFNIPLLKTYKKQLDILTNELDLPEPADWYATLLRLPDALKNDYPEEISDEEKQAIFNAVENAINGLIEFRTQEGAKIDFPRENSQHPCSPPRGGALRERTCSQNQSKNRGIALQTRRHRLRQEPFRAGDDFLYRKTRYQ